MNFNILTWLENWNHFEPFETFCEMKTGVTANSEQYYLLHWRQIFYEHKNKKIPHQPQWLIKTIKENQRIFILVFVLLSFVVLLSIEFSLIIWNRLCDKMHTTKWNERQHKWKKKKTISISFDLNKTTVSDSLNAKEKYAEQKQWISFISFHAVTSLLLWIVRNEIKKVLRLIAHRFSIIQHLWQ